MPAKWYTMDRVEAVGYLDSHADLGLTDKQVSRRLRKYGENRLEEESSPSIWALFFHQFQDFMVIVLMVTTVISALLGEVVDALAILAIIVMNATLGFFQEYRAERSLAALKDLTAPTCKVLRGGRLQIIEAVSVVPGDILVLEAGDRIPADARILDASSLYVDESTLTGESLPVEKLANWTSAAYVGIGDQANMVFLGTLVTRGRCTVIAVATGMDTEIGRIAGMIKDSFVAETPLQARLASLGKWLVIACLVVVGAVFGLGVLQGFPIYKMFMVGVSLAVAAIPEGLPAVVTIALAVGVQRMIRSNAIIRQLPAVETLGCATVICSDKTGTLTKNEMRVQSWYLGGKITDVREDAQERLTQDALLRRALETGAICNHAQVEQKNGKMVTLGDPTEGALVAIALEAGMDVDTLRQDYTWIREIPFDSRRKRMSVLVEHRGQVMSLVKGAPDEIVKRCTSVLGDHGVGKLNSRLRGAIVDAMESMAGQALRVLALAYREFSAAEGATDQRMEEKLTLIGLVGMMDPPRKEAIAAIKQARDAQIRTIMVTGDHKTTATAIASQLGLIRDHSEVVTGECWGRLTPEEHQDVVRRTNVFARVAPEHKLSIVRALQANGEIVGMTGDGVNDAPAVKEADIGISMGLTGTDVTKEASAMVLSDDNYQTIIAAIKEGRAIYDNIRKFIRYLLACNVGEVLTMFAATLFGLPLPLLPIQILWMNLVTDGLPAIALGVDPGDDDIMERPPRAPNEGIFARGLHIKIAFTGLIISMCAIGIFLFSLWYYPGDLGKARTLAFTTLVLAQLIFVFQCRSEYHSVFEIGLAGNPFLIVAVLASLSMHCVILYHPWFQAIFRTVALNGDEWLLVIVFSALSLVLDTSARMVKRQVQRHVSLLKV